MIADIEQIEAHRQALTGHCYRMLGSAVDADDATQETIIRAWKNADQFEGRAALLTWLYRIATNVCIAKLSDRRRRARPIEEHPAGVPTDPLIQHPRTHWIEPVPDTRAIPADADPFERAMLRQSIRLAFVAALQSLAPKQRAALLLVEVLGWSVAEVAETLATSIASVNSALQRARATLAGRNWRAVPSALTESQEQMLNRYVAAFERYDVDQLVALLRDDATFSMPPYSLWLQGPEAVRAWLLGMGSGCRGSRLVATAACGSPAFGHYKLDADGVHKPFALVVLELSGDRIAGWNSFLDTETLFPKFELPPHLPA
ncbi:MAG TPA: sigma-70 family RNA polymerase sigma factor [Bryobacteraceae bacterium]|jgi:RNA polymerase sigma-70 factor (ECF subfamily)|nr:sigma-70 family RNA polymerase sigma factor [Bryobacteraceae bacterium]